MFCPFKKAHDLSVDCVGPKCMWYVCAMLVLAENSKPVKKTTIDLGEGVVYSDLVNK
jgi:hypothetical protein